MKPIRIIMSAFGPYVTKQIIDFRSLGEHKFFLIHGPTGGGKTTILDAICYALYGQTSGDERKGEQMRCTLADANHATEVTFDFELGDKRYRVTRRPAQDRAKARGEGLRSATAEAYLWDRTDTVDDDQEGHPLCVGASKVTDELQRLLGFHCQQFRQVIMLPQGKFRELLIAGSSERESILQTLFQTHLYEQIQEALKEKAKLIQQDAEQLKAHIDGLLVQAEAKNSEELRERLKQKQDLRHAVAGQIPPLRESLKHAQDALNQAKQVETKLAEEKMAAQALAMLERSKPSIDEQRKKLEIARRAQTLCGPEEMLESATKELATRTKNLAAAINLRSQSEIKSKSATDALKAQEARQPELDTQRKEQFRLQSLREKVQRIEEADGLVKVATESLKKITDQIAAAESRHAALQKQFETSSDQLRQAKELAAAHAGNVLAVDLAQKQAAARTALDATRRNKQQLESQQKTSESELAKKNQTMLLAKSELADLQKLWIDAQAAVLAQRLEEGHACPVCGSLEHPTPAHSDAQLPSKEQLNAKQQRVEDQQTAINALTGQIQKIVSDLTIATAQETLQESADESIDALRARLKTGQTALQNSKAASDQIPTLEIEIKKTQERLERAKEYFEKSAIDRQTATDDVTRQITLREEYLQGVPEELRTIASLEVAQNKVKSTIGRFEELQKKAKDDFESAQKLEFASKESEATAAKEQVDAKKAIDAQSVEFNAKLETAGFSTVHEYRAAKLADVQIRQIDAEIQEFDKKLSAAASYLDRARQNAKDLVAPDMPALTQNVADAGEKLEKALKLETEYQNQLNDIVRWLANLDSAAKESEALANEYAVVGSIAQVAQGDNPHRLTFQRFVLAFLLDEVLAAANHRLKVMSNGRYNLERRSGKTDLRSKGGLDLEVCDLWYGVSRDVKTLSGGESFLASLSLALGLADVVQARTGGIRLDTMFIDEGFSTLDTEALELAIRALQDLLKGSRIVGIISHVTELKERIAARLEVSTSREGSRAQFVFS